MKTATLLLLSLISCSCFSQDSRLFEQTWILHDLIINGQSNVPPVNSEQNHIPAYFIEPDEFLTGVCDGTGGAGRIIYNGTTEFSFPEGVGWLAGSCDLNENQIYSWLYQEFWDFTIVDPFQYEIIDVGQNRTLSVTASNGNQAIYGNNFLSIAKFKNESLLVYPIPASDIINLKYNKDISISRIRIYNLQGKQVLLITKNLSQINIESLKSGIYFILAENNENKMLTRKFVKR
ncbi:MAG: T9SS type A sorting domain-containing protein [Aequorivita antarctica]